MSLIQALTSEVVTTMLMYTDAGFPRVEKNPNGDVQVNYDNWNIIIRPDGTGICRNGDNESVFDHAGLEPVFIRAGKQMDPKFLPLGEVGVYKLLYYQFLEDEGVEKTLLTTLRFKEFILHINEQLRNGALDEALNEELNEELNEVVPGVPEEVLPGVHEEVLPEFEEGVIDLDNGESSDDDD